jgi:hypothetical protein
MPPASKLTTRQVSIMSVDATTERSQRVGHHRQPGTELPYTQKVYTSQSSAAGGRVAGMARRTGGKHAQKRDQRPHVFLVPVRRVVPDHRLPVERPPTLRDTAAGTRLLRCMLFLMLHHVDQLAQWIANVETAHAPRFAPGAYPSFIHDGFVAARLG